jgi:hypothetical protein
MDTVQGNAMPIDITVMTRKMRFVLVHYHIFKNAGTTVERILEREFPGTFARLHGPGSDATLDAEDLTSFLDDHPHVQAVTSHHLRYPAPVMRNAVVFDCCFLRHPLDRLDSLYSYYRRIDSNAQVTQIANRGAFTRPASVADLERAVQTVRNMALPGLVEMFQESMVAAEYFMRPAFPSIRLGSGPANVSRQIMPGAPEREQRLIRVWGRELHREITRLNELDIELTEQTRHEIRRRLSMMPAASDRVAEFGDRCTALGAQA